MRLKRAVAIALTMTMGLCLTACGNSTSTSTGKNSAPTSSSGNESNVTAGEVETKENTISLSEEPSSPNYEKSLSGKVVVYMPSPSGLNTKYVEGFEKKTGLEVELFEGTTGEILARLEAEKDNPVADVVVLASWSDGLSFEAQDNLLSYVPHNASRLYGNWTESEKKIFGTSASAVGVIYNTTIYPDLDADWSELADSKYADDLAIPDPQKSGACKDFLAGYMYSTNSDFSAFENMAKNKLYNAGANKAALSSVTTGEKGILVAGVDYNAYSSIAKGEPIQIYYPKSGTVINPRPAMILKTSKNVENAKAFMDYLLSDEAQEMVANAYLLPGRTDVTCSNRLNVNEIPQLKTDWSWMMKNADDIASKLVDLCK